MDAGEVREAAPEDARRIAKVHVRAWLDAYRELLPQPMVSGLSLERRERSWRELLSLGGPTLTLVEERAGSITGFCALMAPGRDEDLDDRTAEVAAIYVDPARWRQGVGSRLMTAAADAVLRSGRDRIALWALRDNQPAVAFYRRLGYEPDGAERTHASGLAEFRLSLALRAGGPAD